MRDSSKNCDQRAAVAANRDVASGTSAASYEIDVEDVEYVRHDGRPVEARIYAPRGEGPFPAVLDLHGGCWCTSSRLSDEGISTRLAKSGLVVAAIDFRQPPDDEPYPASLADVNYATRWLKAHAEDLGVDAARVGLVGSSSGGHMAMLSAMRPRDPRYLLLPLATESGAPDAGGRCVVLIYPVIDPLARYRYAKTLAERGEEPELARFLLVNHERYWQTEEAMGEGNPMLALERGEPVELPPVLYVQGTADLGHPREHVDRFVAAYRAAGGEIALELFEGEDRGFLHGAAESPASPAAFARIIRFLHAHL